VASAVDAGTGEPQIVVLSDEDALAHEAARWLVAGLGKAISERGEAHVALTGGSSAVALYRELIRPEWRTAVDWGRVHLWWGDERFVPVDHPDSNIGLAYNMLLAIAARAGESGSGAQGVDAADGDVGALPIQVENIHPYEVDEALGESEPMQIVAEQYTAELERNLRRRGDLPAFDVILVGVGPDGHILSIFPDSKALRSRALVVTVPAPQDVEPHHPRVSLHPRLLAAAGSVIVMSSGPGKADALAQALGDEHDPARWPAQLARLPNAVWLLDSAAAAKLG
jgi:6-phosphogluconolactonase